MELLNIVTYDATEIEPSVEGATWAVGEELVSWVSIFQEVCYLSSISVNFLLVG
jgi:hypothetical protein